jgi:hypothetical protein
LTVLRVALTSVSAVRRMVARLALEESERRGQTN